MNKETVILLRPGQNRAISLPGHELATLGFATFAVTGLDNDMPIQWSVVGARKSELERGEGHAYPHKCRVHVLNDQYSVEDRIINVSVVGYDSTSKEMVEATAVLTVKVKAADAVDDFTFRLEYTPEVSTDGGTSEPTPAPAIKAIINEVVPTGAGNTFHLICTVDTDDQTSARLVMAQSTVADKGNEFLVDADALKGIVNKCNGVAHQNGYSVLNFTVDALKVWKSDEEKHYKQAQGGKIIITPRG